jgi:hypothetical protein
MMRTGGMTGFLALALTLGLSACGGGNQVAGGGTGGTGTPAVVSRGPITAATPAAVVAAVAGTAAVGEQITVNGVTYDLGTATVFLPSGTAILREGMVVTVRGSLDAVGAVTGKASEVVYRRELAGIIAAQPVANQLVVYGQNVFTDNLTRYEPVDCVPAAGQWIEVSGYLAADGNLRATYVECSSAGAEVELSGIITAIGTGSITLGGSTVVSVGSDVYDIGLLSSGMSVEVHAATPDPAATALIATELEPLDGGLGGDDGDDGEVSGLITAVDLAANRLTVAGQQVVLQTTTTFSGGVAADLVLGARIEVQGKFSGGLLLATGIDFEDDLEIVATVDTVSGNGFTLLGLPGVGVTYDPLLVESDVALPPAPGSAVALRGRLDPAVSSGVFATHIESGEALVVDIQAPVAAIATDRSYIELLGVQVSTPAGLSYSINDATVDHAAFFAALSVGELVDVHGELSGGNVTWLELELED